jgi:RNase H-fold protein (predicted Holliday junction resolvase)
MSQSIQVTEKQKEEKQKEKQKENNDELEIKQDLKKLIKKISEKYKVKIVLQDNRQNKSTESRVLDQHFFSSEGAWVGHIKSML